MPRKHVFLNPIFPFHVSARCINKEWFGVPLNELWNMYTDYLYFINKAYNIQIISFVLMPNHFHLIVQAPFNNLSEAMNYFMRETSKNISRRSGRINQIYGGPYHKSCLDNDAYFLTAYKYVYRNPVEAGLTNVVETYPFSTLNGLIGMSKLIIPIAKSDVLFRGDVSSALRWLNWSYLKGQKERIRKALKKSTFQFAKMNLNAKSENRT